MMTRRLLQLLIGLAMYGVSLAMFIRAGLGLDPWDVFHQGLAGKTGLSIGTVVVIVSFLVLLLWIPLRQRPGFGTLSNAVLVGMFADVGLALIPEFSHLAGRSACSRERCCSTASLRPATSAPASARARGTA